MLQLNEKTLLGIAASFGIGTAPIWPSAKTVAELRRSGVFGGPVRPNSSIIRRASIALGRRPLSSQPVVRSAQVALRGMVKNEANYVGKVLRVGTQAGSRSVNRLGAARLSLRWGLIGVLYYEAGLSIVSGYNESQQPIISGY